MPDNVITEWQWIGDFNPALLINLVMRWCIYIIKQDGVFIQMEYTHLAGMIEYLYDTYMQQIMGSCQGQIETVIHFTVNTQSSYCHAVGS